jgi:hypothetical protein
MDCWRHCNHPNVHIHSGAATTVGSSDLVIEAIQGQDSWCPADGTSGSVEIDAFWQGVVDAKLE